MITKATLSAGLLMLLAACSQDTSENASVFEGKNVSYIVATNAGGGYDAYARMISPYLQKQLKADNVIIRNVPGAGHIVGTNTLWRAKKNGLTLGTFNVGLVYGQLVGQEGINFDLRKFEWVGKAAGEPRAIVVSEKCDIKSMADLMAAETAVKFGSAGIGSASYSDMMLLADALDLKVDVIAGFDGTEGEMSMMRGEICAVLGSTSSFQSFVDTGNGSFILAIGGDIPGTPRAIEFAKDEHARQQIDLIDTLAQLGRITALPPGTPPDIVETVRAAYRAALEDPDLLAEAKKQQRPIEPMYGEDVGRLIDDVLKQTPETVEMIRKAINGSVQ